MQFELTLLGTNSAVPSLDRFTTAQVLTVGNRSFLIDCGEGAQIRLRQYNLQKASLGHIFISHLHGDHFYGLIGLLTSYALIGRTRPVQVFAPPGLEEIIRIQLPGDDLPFELHFQVVNPEVHQCIFQDKFLEVHTIPLRHRIPTAGYLFRERPRPRNIRPEVIEKYNIPYWDIPAIKDGADLSLPDGRVIPNAQLTLDPPLPRSYAFCSDTLFEPAVIPIIQGVDLLYHEATFCEDLREHAAISMHSTAREAATIAREAGVGRLILGHYSTRYKNLDSFLKEARAVFPETELGEDGRKFAVPFTGRREG